MTYYNKVTPEIIAAIQQIVGSQQVLADPEKMETYAHDEETEPSYHHCPELVVFPASADEVAEILRLANREKIPVTPRGAGSGLACGAVPVYGGIVLSLERMNRILELNTENLSVVVEPGVRTIDIQAAAAAVGLLYAGDPCSSDSCWIGGNVATNAGGNRAVKYGTTRDQIYALQVVTPQGDIAELGGRLAKNSTGYCLEKLISGSEGTLGVVTRITLKLWPLPPHVRTLLAVFPDAAAAIAILPVLRKAGITPTCLEFMENSTVRSIALFLNKRLPHSELGHYLIIEIDGNDADTLDDQCVLIDDLCEAGGALAVEMPDRNQIWDVRRAYAEALRAESLIYSKEDIVVPVDCIPALLKEVELICARYELVTRTASHAGDGNVHLNVLRFDLPQQLWEEKITAFQQELYTCVYRLGGKLSGEHGIGYKRRELMEQFADPGELLMMKAIKRALDPNLILNPGKVLTFAEFHRAEAVG